MTQSGAWNPAEIRRYQESFDRQGFMKTIGARLTAVAPGETEIIVPFSETLTQQHGFFHGGLVGTIADNAAGIAAYTMMAKGDSILTIEYKLNLMVPAQGDALIARGRVIRSGRRITTGQADVFARRDGKEIQCATLLGTFMTMHNTPDDSSFQRSK